jgi:hypothetical protein
MKPEMPDLTPIRRSLERNSADQERNCVGLEQLRLDHAALWQQLGWDRAQIKLWLRCLPDIQIDRSDPADPLYRLPVTARPPEILRIHRALAPRLGPRLPQGRPGLGHRSG